MNAKNTKQGSNGNVSGDIVTTGADAREMVWGKGSVSIPQTDDLLMRGAELFEKTIGQDGGGGFTMGRVVKLEKDQGIRGTFRGYVPTRIKALQGDGEGDGMVTLNYVALECRAGNGATVTVLHLGNAQIMQQMQMADARPGDDVALYRPNRDDIEIQGGRRVRPFDVLVKHVDPTVVGMAFASRPAGKWGEAARLSEGHRVAALPSGSEQANTVEAEQASAPVPASNT